MTASAVVNGKRRTRIAGGLCGRAVGRKGYRNHVSCTLTPSPAWRGCQRKTDLYSRRWVLHVRLAWIDGKRDHRRTRHFENFSIVLRSCQPVSPLRLVNSLVYRRRSKRLLLAAC